MPYSRTHVVIGDGATAARFAVTAPLRAGDHLIVLGPQARQLGRGLAYQDHDPAAPWRYAYLLNSPSEVVHPDFGAWFTRHWDRLSAELQHHQPGWLRFGAEAIAANDLGALFAPRAIFGHWVREQTRAGLARLEDQGVTVTLHDVAVSGVTPADTGLRVRLADGTEVMADRVDLATGGAENRPFDGTPGAAVLPMLYGAEARIAARLRPGMAVTCLGGNAAMLDTLRLLQSLMPEADIRMRVISRGRAPEPLLVHRPRRAAVAPAIRGPFATAADCLASMDAEIARFRAKGAGMTQLRTGYSALFDTPGIAALVPDITEQRILQQSLEGRFRRGTHDSLADYARLVEAGQIEVIAGAVRRVTAQGEDSARVTVDAGGQVQEIEAPLVINTAGPRDPLALEPLAADLLARGVLRSNPLGRGVALRAGLLSEDPRLRYLSPAVTEIGQAVLPFPLYDVSRLWREVDAAQAG